MEWLGKSHPLEMAAEWGAPLVLASTTAWAAWAAGLPLAAQASGGVIALSIGIVAMRMASRAPLVSDAGFEPADLELDDDDVLLLEDRLAEPAADSRVVQLFARADPTPGELILRISDYLSEQGKPATDALPVEQQVDSSAALHSALANIRANLR